MVIVLALAFSLSAIVTIYTLFRSGNTEVPNVVGRPEAEAQQLAEQAGLRVKIQRRSDSTVAPNSVIETRPGPKSSVKKDSVLTIVVSSGPIQTKSQLEPPPRSSPGRRHKVRRFVVDTARVLIGSIKEAIE
jgi:beta-lactam-binding protein with PASTA domain